MDDKLAGDGLSYQDTTTVSPHAQPLLLARRVGTTTAAPTPVPPPPVAPAPDQPTAAPALDSDPTGPNAASNATPHAPAVDTAALDAAVAATHGAARQPVSEDLNATSVDFAGRRRKMGRFAIGFAVLAVFAVYRMGFAPPSAPATPAPAPLATEQVAAEANMVLTSALITAAEHKASSGTFVGFTAERVSVATGRDTIVATTVVADHCFFGGIVPGSPAQVQPDPTGEACSPQMLAIAQASITDGEAAALEGDRLAAAAQFDTAATEAVTFAGYNGNAAGPSLAGFDRYEIPGVEVREVSPDATAARIQVPLPSGGCLIGVVTVNGANPDPAYGICEGP